MTAYAANLLDFSEFRPRTIGTSAPAQLISRCAVEVEAHFTDTISSRRSIPKLLGGLLKVFAECSTQDWDGYGAKAISTEIIDKALAYATSLPPDLPMPEFCPEPDGEIALEWFGRNGATISISIGEANQVSYSAIFPDNNCVNGTENYKSFTREMLESYIRRTIED